MGGLRHLCISMEFTCQLLNSVNNRETFCNCYESWHFTFSTSTLIWRFSVIAVICHRPYVHSFTLCLGRQIFLILSPIHKRSHRVFEELVNVCGFLIGTAQSMKSSNESIPGYDWYIIHTSFSTLIWNYDHQFLYYLQCCWCL